MMDTGVVGYLSKEITAEQLISAIRRAVDWEILFSNEQYTRATNWKEGVGKKIAQLTDREIEILNLLAKGLNNLEIAATLDISAKTAAYHVTNILSKLQLKSRQEAAVWAAKHLSDNLE